MSVIKVCYSWNDIEKLVSALVLKTQTKPNIVVSIGRGGLIPGTILSQKFNCNILNIGLKSYEGSARKNIQEYQPISCFESLRDMNILIVDDIADSGETLKYVNNKFKGNWCEHIQTATLFYKPKSTFKPDYYAKEIQNEEWIVFPWEVQ